MKRRIAAALLWFYVGWLAWSIIAWVTALPEVGGPILGTVLAALFAGDPMGRIWGGSRARPVASGATPATTPAAEPA